MPTGKGQIGPELQRLIDLLAKLPGLGPRSAKRAALYLLKKREPVMRPLAYALAEAADKVAACSTCGNWDSIDPCAICADAERDGSVICVVQDVGDLWALERAGAHRGLYHVLGGLLSPLDGVGPDDLNIGRLVERARAESVKEVVLALPATVDGQSTAHYLSEHLAGCAVALTRLSQGVPVGGELDYLDEGTLAAAMKTRRPA
ncbi:recombination mediator RecR [Amphiplicatus metriothermophilus]|uniref:Recombination protein RecR n=1 Tax=Amphiplicatus metriothermophilus TaxID=1519374 RepID=A0A239PKU7_9PROT|nr:recombination mediator RecR [Amphiplicatus metriothermophilus]MBB5517460.1 recombination protein RecR [Amphiplicatus metriothermophilus]SNT68205.1 DNA replication and repair protein RecR [Amphiplicatus metriothermophilus]